MLPVTAGVSGGAISTPNLRQGDFVQGYFLDGEDAQQPVIMGVIGSQPIHSSHEEPPDTAFLPFQWVSQLKMILLRPVSLLLREEEEASCSSRRS